MIKRFFEKIKLLKGFLLLSLFVGLTQTLWAQSSPFCKSAANNCGFEYISSVQINNTTYTGNTSVNDPTYKDLTDNGTVYLEAGKSYNISINGVVVKGSWPEYVRVWFDFNKNGDLDDAGELVFEQHATFSGQHTFTGTITIPQNALNYAVYARVEMRFASEPQSCNGSMNNWCGNTIDFKAWISGGLANKILVIYPPKGYNDYIGSVVSSPEGINISKEKLNVHAFFAYNSVVTLTAIAPEDAVFVGWSGDVTGTSSSIAVTMDDHKYIYANFEKKIKPLDPTAVLVSENQICKGTYTVLTAEGADGSVYWYEGSCDGTLVGKGNSISVSPSVNTTYFARNYKNGYFSDGCASATVEINKIAPVINVNNIVKSLNFDGKVNIEPFDVYQTIDFACEVASITLDRYTFDCSNIGENLVTITATDINGNSSSAVATVTIYDFDAPTVVTKNVTLSLDANGTATISAADINNGSTDACGIASYTLDKTTFDCSNVGENLVTLTVTDVNGNVSSATATVTIVDNIAPSIVCPANISIVSQSDDCSPAVTWADPLATDNCAFSVWGSNASGDHFSVGTSTVTYIVTDASGNKNECSFDVTVTPIPLVSAIKNVSVYAGNYNVSCKGMNDGSATVVVSGGCLPYSYAWSDGQTSDVATGLSAGTYAVTATDANGTTTIATVKLIEPSLLQSVITSPFVVSKYNTSCKIDGDGSISLVVDGGVSPYSLNWSNGTQGSFELTGLKAGAYAVTVTDKNGCVTNNAITLTKPDNCNCLPTPSAPTVTCAVCQEYIDGKTNTQLASGKVSCVNRNFNGNVNTQKSTLVICGDAIISSLNLMDGDKVVVLGTLKVQNLNINTNTVLFENYGTITVTGSANLNGKITNNGTVTFQALNINVDGTLVNNGYTTIKSNFNFNGAFVNNGQFKVEGDVNLNSGASFTNNCTLDLANISINSLKTCTNNGTLTATKQMLLNSANIQLGAGSVTLANSFTESQSNLINTGTNCNLVQVATTSLLNNGIFNGAIAFCDKNGIETNNNVKLINGASFNCASCLYVSTTTKSYDESNEAENNGNSEIEGNASDAKFAVYPTPVSLDAFITISLGDEINTVSVYSILGSKIIQKTVNTTSVEIPAKDLGLGTYVVKVIGKDGKIFNRLIIVQ